MARTKASEQAKRRRLGGAAMAPESPVPHIGEETTSSDEEADEPKAEEPKAEEPRAESPKADEEAGEPKAEAEEPRAESVARPSHRRRNHVVRRGGRRAQGGGCASAAGPRASRFRTLRGVLAMATPVPALSLPDMRRNGACLVFRAA